MSTTNTKEKIYNLIEKIITYEDQLKACEQSTSLRNANADLVKNKENIDLLNQFIKNEFTMSTEKVNGLKEEIKQLSIQLNQVSFTPTKFTNKNYEQSLLKQKCFENTLLIYDNKLNGYEENLKMLKEEKATTDDQLVNLMSIKETYEENLSTNSKFLFKNLIISYDNFTGNSISMSSSISGIKNLNTNLEPHELENLSISKISSYLYNQILTKFITSLTYDVQNNISGILDDVYEKYKKKYLKIDDFVRNSAVNIINSDSKLINFVDEPKLELILRYIIKIFAFERSINEKLNFVNNEYKKDKKLLKTIIQDLQNETKELKDKIDAEEKEEKVIVADLESVKNKEKFKKKILEKENEINQIIAERDKNVENYKKEIKDLEKLNSIIELKYKSSGENEKEVTELKKKIDEAFFEIKNILRQAGPQEDNLLNMFINEINSTLNNETKDYQKLENSQYSEISESLNASILSRNKNNYSTIVNNINNSISIPKQTLNKTLPPIPLNLNKNFQTKSTNTNTTLSTLTTFNTGGVANTIQSDLGIEIQKRLTPLYIPSDCYMQIIDLNEGETQNIFHPLNDYDATPEQKSFIKSTIQLTKDNQTLIFTQLGHDMIEMSIKLLEKTIVTGVMKQILNIIQLFNKKYQCDQKKLLGDSNLIKNELQMSQEAVMKSIYNKYFCFSAILTVDKKINLIFLNYLSFKNWLNGMACIIKNKKEVIYAGNN